jgi:uncharacterized membrane protein YheB (UPF0754 family)
MKVLLFWIVPPLLGAIIGFITNVVAIKMLFRPLKEKRIFGIRIPFTPGILPRQRYVLAQSIGGMVERELLTPEILRARLAQTDIREGLKTALEEYTGNLFNMPPTKWVDQVSGYVIEGARAAYPEAAEALCRFLRKKEIRDNIEVQARNILSRAILEMNVFQRFIIMAGQYDRTLDEKIPEIVEDLLVQAETLFRYKKKKKKFIRNLEQEILALPETHPDLTLDKIFALGNSGPYGSPKTRLDSFLVEQILSTADKKADTLLHTINIKNLVADRIDSLDMLRVERIILDVLAGQLWWISFFGGILGALIGFSQVILSLFIRT